MKLAKILLAIILVFNTCQVYAQKCVVTPITTEAQRREQIEHESGWAVDIKPTINGKAVMTPDVIADYVVTILKQEEFIEIWIEVPEVKWKEVKSKLLAKNIDIRRVKWSKDLDGTQIKSDCSTGENIHLLHKKFRE